jgi:DNA polymerase-4
LLYQNKTVSKIGTGEAKPFGKLEILETLPLNPLPIQKIPMLGDVTFSYCLELYSYSNYRKCLSQSFATNDRENGIEIWKSERNR